MSDTIIHSSYSILIGVILAQPIQTWHLLGRAADRTGLILTERTMHDEYRHILKLDETEKDTAKRVVLDGEDTKSRWNPSRLLTDNGEADDCFLVFELN